MEQSIVNESLFNPIIPLIYDCEYNPVHQTIKVSLLKPHGLNINIDLVKSYFKEDVVLNYTRNEVAIVGTIKSPELSKWIYVKLRDRLKLQSYA